MSHEKRVRRGRLDVEASLDLHGLTQDAAKHLLLRFIADSRAEGLRHVLVITGKGASLRELAHPEWNREAPGVLKRRLPDWLSEPAFRGHVVAYAPAHRRHGGGGAFYLTLKRPA